MLQTQTVSEELLELLKKIMNSPFFGEFRLVGGTALALQLGHRNSVDIDLFAEKEIDADLFVEEIKEFGEVKILQKSKNILILSVNNIKVDFVNHRYHFLDETIQIENIRMATKKDIAAMKLNAISGRGSRKDFIDLYFLLNFFTLNEMMKFYDAKYEEGSFFLVLKSLTYFEDADSQLSPLMHKSFDWESAKNKILSEFGKL